jgi:hypothetical protein
MRFLLALVCTLAVQEAAWAVVSQTLNFTIHEEYVSTRALGMGNAFTAVADDHSAIFYNPAMLAYRTDGQLRMFLRASTDADSLQLFNQIKAIKKEPSGEQVQSYANLIENNYGKHYYFRIPTVGAMLVEPGWGIAFIPADLSLDMDLNRLLGPALTGNFYIDSTLAASFASKLNWFGKDHDLAWGVTAKAIHRVYEGQEIFAEDLANGANVFSTSGAGEGLTGDVDLGTSWRPPVPEDGFFSFLQYMKPSFAIVGRNLLDYGFRTNLHLINKHSGEPPRLYRRVDFGTKWDLPKFWVFDPHFSADIRDVGYPGWSWRKGEHFGAEFYWKMYNWWKGHWAAGFNQGYWTAGFGARLAWFQLDLATYGEDVGSNAGPKEDRRYMVELALDF